MRIESTDRRKRLYSTLVDVSGERAKSKAIDRAARFYIDMVDQRIPRLMEAAEEEGSLTAVEIAELLDSPQLAVDASVEFSVEPE